ncbi:STAS domain-containing protein [Ekhidna sp.]|uniref:STAS domain-containing protein n=1 Tax=Ekhidna sp. TaxID=2608089 RepID=UPI0032EC7700
MKYSKDINNGVLKLNFSGDLIGENNGPEVVELANDAISNGVTHCLLNISDVRYINSSGIGVLITLLTKFRNQNGELYIIKPSEHVNKLLIMTKLQAIFNIAETEEEALQKIK